MNYFLILKDDSVPGIYFLTREKNIEGKDLRSNIGYMSKLLTRFIRAKAKRLKDALQGLMI